ncbi:MAG: response regulator, partial [Alphaproteobacteria bacterium]
ADMLQEAGFVVVDAASAEEAMAALQTVAIDALVTDVNLPGLSGPAFADKARALRPGVGVVFATGDTAAVPAGTDAVILAKPYRGAALAAAVVTALGDRTVAEEDAAATVPARSG